MKPAPGSDGTAYDIILTGEILPGHHLDDVKRAVASLFQTDVAQVADLFLRRERTIKRRLPRDKAESYLRAFAQAGAAVRMQASAPVESGPDSAPPTAPPSTAAPAAQSRTTVAARAPSVPAPIASGTRARSSGIMLVRRTSYRPGRRLRGGLALARTT